MVEHTPPYYASIACLPVVVIGTLVYIYYRHCYPIIDRVPYMNILLCVLIIIAHGQVIMYVDGHDPAEPCAYGSIILNVIIIPVGTFTFLARAWFLLFKLEITAEIAGRENASQSSFIALDSIGSDRNTARVAPLTPMIDDAPAGANGNNDRSKRQPSWYLLNHRYMRNKFIGSVMGTFLFVCCALTVAIAVARGQGPCANEPKYYYWIQIFWCAFFTVGQGILLAIVAKKISKHQADGLGIRRELLSVACIVISYGPGFVIFQYGTNPRFQYAMLMCWITFAWMATTVYPLILMVRHNRRQHQLASSLQTGTATLEQLLESPEATQAFAQFAAKEFTAESLSCYLRCKAFKAIGRQQTNQSDRVVLLGTNHQDTSAKTPAAIAAIALREAYSIYRLFVAPNSHFEVNLSAPVVKEISTNLQSLATAISTAVRTRHAANNTNNNNNLTSGGTVITMNDDMIPTAADEFLLASVLAVYDNAMTELLALMKANSFARFKTSPQWGTLVATLKQNNGRVGRGLNGESVAAQAASRVEAHPSVSQPVSFLGGPKGGNGGASGGASAVVSAIGYIGHNNKPGGGGAASKNGSQYSARPSVNQQPAAAAIVVAPPAPTVHTPSSHGGGGSGAVAAAHAWSNAMVAATTGTTATAFGMANGNTSSSSVASHHNPPTIVVPLSPLAAHSSATATASTPATTTHTAASSTNVQRYIPATHDSGIMIGTITRSHSGV